MSKLIMLGPSRSPNFFSNHPGGQGFNLHRRRCWQLRWHGQLHVTRARAWEGPGKSGAVLEIRGDFARKRCEQMIDMIDIKLIYTN